ncbi:NAD-dependent epimerase/dehydratase family protein [Pseudaestuariivita sp.]|uniref:NAD-dependent epimerase/dehydratase family protein n=1 Tax=Pseudaestuariivita sp. TaxID=2211669 RepID=UPI0040583FB3
MGEVGRVLITGASGFIGRATVAEAVARGWYVTAFSRGADVPGAQVVRTCDLAEPSARAALDEELPRVDAVIHCAASLSGDPLVQSRDTDRATQTLLQALAVAPKRLVHVSSIAVIGAMGHANGALIDETSEVETRTAGRDAYARAKLVQEQHVRATARDIGLPVWIMRPGAVFGPDRLWNAHIGPTFGPTLVRMETRGQVPLSYIDHCAQALVLAAGQAPEGIQTVHVLDDDLPTRARFLAAMRQTGWPERVVPFHWRWLRPAAALLGQSGTASSLFQIETLRARYQPLTYSNAALHALGWTPGMDFDAAFAASVAGTNA